MAAAEGRLREEGQGRPRLRGRCTLLQDVGVVASNGLDDQCIAAHLFCFYINLLASVFRLFTPQNKRLVTSFNKKNDQCIAAQLFVFITKSLLGNFDCLPIKISILRRHSIRKMISASRRIFFVITFSFYFSISITQISRIHISNRSRE